MNLSIDGSQTGCRIYDARSWWRRAVGLLATPDLTDPCGLWLKPCNSVHMFGMRYAIDVLFLDRDGQVCKIVPVLKPWRMAACRGAASTLELRAGLSERLGLRTGARVGLVAAE